MLVSITLQIQILNNELIVKNLIKIFKVLSILSLLFFPFFYLSYMLATTSLISPETISILREISAYLMTVSLYSVGGCALVLVVLVIARQKMTFRMHIAFITVSIVCWLVLALVDPGDVFVRFFD